MLKTGKTAFQIGSNENLFDWTYVDNVVHAHLVAAERLELSVSFAELDTRLPPVDKDIPRRALPTSTYRPESLMPAEKALNPAFVNTSVPDAPLGASRTQFDQWFPNSTNSNPDEPYSIPIAGQAFFITNGEPIYFWDFPRAVWAEYNGHVSPYTIALPVAVGLAAASAGEVISGWLGKVPTLTRGKVVYSTTHRYYNIEKVRPWRCGWC